MSKLDIASYNMGVMAVLEEARRLSDILTEGPIDDDLQFFAIMTMKHFAAAGKTLLIGSIDADELAARLDKWMRLLERERESEGDEKAPENSLAETTRCAGKA